MPADGVTEKGRPAVIIATGVDLIEIARVERAIAERGQRFVERVFSSAETTYCEGQANPAASFAVRFAAKEAVTKCLGTGWAGGVGFDQVEVVRVASGAVGVRLSGRAAEVARELGIARVHLSLSHTSTHAMAMAVGEG